MAELFSQRDVENLLLASTSEDRTTNSEFFPQRLAKLRSAHASKFNDTAYGHMAISSCEEKLKEAENIFNLNQSKNNTLEAAKPAGEGSLILKLILSLLSMLVSVIAMLPPWFEHLRRSKNNNPETP